MNGGLTSAEAAQRLTQSGPNELAREHATPAWRLLLHQFRGALIWLLFGACVVSAVLGEVGDAVAIATILSLNAFVGFLQEHRAERALFALRAMSAPRATVLRDGGARQVPAREVVPGDVLLLEAGDVVAADARLLEAHRLSAQEAALTGESVPVEKQTQPVDEGAPLAERKDRVFAGTSIATGSGRAEVFATGMSTELGKIAQLLSSAREEQTPLQQRLTQLGKLLLVLCLAIVALVAAAGLWRGAPALEVLMVSISLAVAAVPEGLTTVVTIALSLGVQRMSKRNVLVRRLAAVETLGSTSVICTDKTGTLTAGVMAVREVYGERARVLFAAAANCEAELSADGKSGTGDPTELALLAAAAELGIHRETIERERPRRAVHPFDAERRMMSILRADGVLYLKGASESVLPLCDGDAPAALEASARMAERGLRVLAVAVGRTEREADLTLVGLVGLADPPRPEAIDAVAQAKAAGIRTVMITGDHPKTAAAIAREMGIVGDGEDTEGLVHARATPEDKLRIVREWKDRRQIVAMTGDGVNDAPALKEAHIGIAMGKTGTEVTREASDMVLVDDNFASIVAAVKEGRGIYQNIRRTLVYLLTGNFGELVLMLAAAVLAMPVPLLPLQLLWINLVTDGLPALALAVEPTRPDLLRHPPRPLDEPALGRNQWLRVVITGVLEAALVLAAYAWALERYALPTARNFAFSVLVFAEVFRAFAARSHSRNAWQIGFLKNPLLILACVLSALAQLVVQRVPAMQALFELGPMSWELTGWSILLGLVPATVLELAKGFQKRAAA